MRIEWRVAAIGIGLVLVLAASISAPTASLGAESSDINLNAASSIQLLKLPGVSVGLAKAIIEYRTRSGPFKSPQDLLKVPGMTEEILSLIAPKMDQKGDLVSSAGIETEVREEFTIPRY
jgi:competence protein ComEA